MDLRIQFLEFRKLSDLMMAVSRFDLYQIFVKSVTQLKQSLFSFLQLFKLSASPIFTHFII